MNPSSPDSAFQGALSGFDSLNCVNLIIDGPSDTTVRPCRPEHLAQLKAERDKILRWRQLSQQPPDADKPAGPTNGPANP